MNWIIRQLQQPSTWKGLFVLAGLIGYKIDPSLQEQIIIAVTAIIAGIEIYRNEHKPKPVTIQLPPIDLVSTHLAEKETQTRRVTDRADPVASCGSAADQLREPVSSNNGFKSNGWNG